MTGNNSTPAEKLRAVFLAALMIGSVFAMGVAFSGTAGAAVGNNAVTLSVAGNTVGDDVTVTVSSLDAGEEITIEHAVEGTVRNTVTVADGGSNDEGSNANEVVVTLSAGTSGTVTATDADDNSDSESYSVGNYYVTTSPENVTHGDTVTVQGNIYEYWTGDPATSVLEDDETMDYSLVFDADISNGVTTDDIVLADSDTNSGQFSVERTFDEVDTGGSTDHRNDYPGDETTVNNPPAYNVYVDPASDNPETANSGLSGYDGSTPSADNNVGSATVESRLDVTAQADTDTITYDETVDISGDVSNVSGGLASYAVKLNTPADVTAKTTDTAQTGGYTYTAVFNDAGDWTFGTNEGAFIQYETFTVEGQEADLSITPQDDNLAFFQETYDITLEDSSGNAIDTDESGTSVAEGYINITGPFQETNLDDQSDVLRAVTVDTDGDETDDQTAYIHVATGPNGEASFTATPIGGSVDATLENADDGGNHGTEVNTDSDSQPEPGLENTQDAADTPLSPDYVGSASADVSGAQPVNVINFQTEDPQDVNPTGPEDGTPPYSPLETDAGPDVVEVLPLAQNEGEGNDLRLHNGYRLGFDENQDFEGMTQYRLGFELRDENNDAIAPSSLDTIDIAGAGINGSVLGDPVSTEGDNVVSASYAGSGQYYVLVRPTEVTEENEQIEIQYNVVDEDPVSTTLNASGLYVEDFLVDGESVDAVEPNSEINVSSVIKDATQGADPVPINNGRVRVSQDNQQIAQIDARTANVNDGQYAFTNVQVGPRGIDGADGSPVNGIGDDIAELTFTAYQYADASDDQALEQTEVTKATVETLDLKLEENLEITYDAENTSTYAGTDENGVFTLTRGVEYNQIAFELTDDEGAVDLTEGIDQDIPDLNAIAHDAESGEKLVTLTTTDSNGDEVTLDVRFDTEASNASAGYYVISDIENANNVSSAGDTADLADDNSFVFDGTLDANAQPFTLNIETPDRSQATNASETGTFEVANAQLQTEIVGVTSENINGTTYSDLAHDQTDTEFNATEDIEAATIGIDRTYRVNATATDALGTELNGTVDGREVVVVFTGDDADDGDEEPNYANFEMVDGDGVNTVEASTQDDGTNGNNGVIIENENGSFQFDVQPNEAIANGEWAPTFTIEDQVDAAGDDGGSAPSGTTAITGTPVAQNPVVEVYDVNGATLPTNPSESSDNLVLAQDVTNNLRVEAFPADPNDFVLPDGLEFGFPSDDPFAENVVGTTTSLSEDVTTGDFEEGQIGFLSVTPTGTGTGIIELVDANDGSTTATTVVDTDGNPIVFDVLRSNLQVDIGLSSSTIDAGNNVTVSLTERATGADISDAGVSLVDPNGNVVAEETTNINGEVTFEVAENATGGTYTVETRPAGYQPNSVELNVNADEGADNPTVGDNPPAQNLDNDPLLEDVNGDGEGNLFDALTYYNNQDSDAIQDNPDLFDFDGDGSAGDLFDALALYNEISA